MGEKLSAGASPQRFDPLYDIVPQRYCAGIKFLERGSSEGRVATGRFSTTSRSPGHGLERHVLGMPRGGQREEGESASARSSLSVLPHGQAVPLTAPTVVRGLKHVACARAASATHSGADETSPFVGNVARRVPMSFGAVASTPIMGRSMAGPTGVAGDKGRQGALTTTF